MDRARESARRHRAQRRRARRPGSAQWQAVVVAGLVGLAGVGCAEVSDEAAADEAAYALLDDVRGDYPSWATMPGYDVRRPSRSPHGNAVEVYVNAALAAAIDEAIATDGVEADGPWPVGSVVVKDGYDGDALISRALMRKTAEGWFYGLFRADDALVAAGYDIYCTDCHDDGRDGLLSPDAAW